MGKKSTELVKEYIFIFIIDKNFTVQYFNDYSAKLFKSSRHKLTGKHIKELFPPDIYKIQKRNLQKVFKSNKALTFVNRIKFPAKELLLNTYLVPFKLKDDKDPSILGIARNITPQEQIQELIATAKHQWEHVIDTMPDIIALIDTDYRIVRVNKAMARHLGIPFKKVIGLKCYEYLHTQKRPPPFCPLISGKEAGNEQHNSENCREYINGDKFIKTFPLYDLGGRLTGCFYIARRERIASDEESFQKHEKIMQLVIRNAQDIFFVQDTEGKYIFFDTLPKCSLEMRDFIGKTPFDFFEPAAASNMVELINKVMSSGQELNEFEQFENMMFFQRIFPIKNTGNNVIAVATVFQKISELASDKKEDAFPCPPLHNLTRRECEILRHIVSGCSSRQIAEKLCISKTTVDTHRARIMQKCNLHKTAELVQLAIKLGLQ